MAFVFIDPKRNRKKAKKSDEAQRVLDVLDDYLEGNIQEPVRWLVRFWKDQAAVFTYAELRKLVSEDGEADRLYQTWFQDYSKLLSDKITPMWKEAFLAGAHSHPTITSAGFEVNTSATNVREWILERGAELVTNVTEQQVDAIKYVLAESRVARMSTAETAQYIRPIIGLTKPQASANLRYYNSMKDRLREDHPRMTDASIEKKARIAAAKYAEKQQRTRAETIARTEAAYAYNYGNDTAIRQAVEQGKIPIMRKIWSTAADGHVCGACEDLEGTEIDMDKDFSVTIGKKVKRTLSAPVPPLHPRCKCAVMYEETGEYKRPTEVSYGGLEENWSDLGENADIFDVNPDDRNDNCVNTVIAFEMRSRGKSVVAGEGMPELMHNSFAGWIKPDVIPVTPGREAFSYIDNAMALWGEGAKAQISFLYPPMPGESVIHGHSFVAIWRNGGASYIDVQHRKVYNIDEVRDMLTWAHTIDFARIDRRDISELGFKACKEVK